MGAKGARVLTFNKENWSGEGVTITVNSEGYFSIYGYRFRLVQTSPNAFKVHGDDQWGGYPVVHGLKLDDTWIAAEGNSIDDYEGAYSREDADPVAAAAKVLFNII